MPGSIPGTRGSSPLTALQLFALLFPPPFFFLFYFFNKKKATSMHRNWPDLQIDIYLPG